MQHLITCCNRQEAASDFISGVAVEYMGTHVPANLVVLGQTRSHDIRAAHFVMDDERRRRRPTDPVAIGQNAGVLNNVRTIYDLQESCTCNRK